MYDTHFIGDLDFSTTYTQGRTMNFANEAVVSRSQALQHGFYEDHPEVSLPPGLRPDAGSATQSFAGNSTIPVRYRSCPQSHLGVMETLIQHGSTSDANGLRSPAQQFYTHESQGGDASERQVHSVAWCNTNGQAPLKTAKPSTRVAADNDSKKRSTSVKQQFHKTKICSFYQMGNCNMGDACSYAHTYAELQASPSLRKTRLCSMFFRHKCFKKDCDYAHGYDELQGTTTLFKTRLCRWYMRGLCRAGSNCRYAHNREELRNNTPAGSKSERKQGKADNLRNVSSQRTTFQRDALEPSQDFDVDDDDDLPPLPTALWLSGTFEESDTDEPDDAVSALEL
eukprot:TRINITY_DN13079_c1_g1_i2.p1 TRINITY_DN13079_c1_g1~~TRINITY_DN13079_c1_g1_i2.p1  ORF type:complete len:340 (-),score=34.96 TRINITY_DN13079_c1_g1_i2:265-1284(-)